MVARSVVVLVALLIGLTPVSAGRQPAAARDNLVLVTLDGVRMAEIFGGLDADIFRSTLAKDAKLEDQPAYRRFNGATAQERREKLMPFFWREWMVQHGSIAGNTALKSVVTLTNTHRFSYPGYSGILTGEAHDDVIKSNDRVQNPYPTILEELKSKLTLPTAGVAAFGSWDAFNEIVEHTPGSITVNAGYASFATPDKAGMELSRMQFETLTPWNSVRHDAYTFGLAMTYFRATSRGSSTWRSARPTTGPTTAGTIACSKRWRAPTMVPPAVDVARIAASLSRADPHPDHDRPRPRPDRGGLELPRREGRRGAGRVDGIHQSCVQAARRVADQPPIHTNQAAATMANWLGVDWTAGRAGVGRVIR